MEGLRGECLSFFEKGSHYVDHVERVVALAKRLAEFEGADVEVVEAAAWLHDAGRAAEDLGECEDHAVESARLAPELLRRAGFPEEKIAAVVKCVERHRYSKGLKAETIEEAVLQDADRLDALGAIGIYRAIKIGLQAGKPFYDASIKPAEVYAGNSKTTINHFHEKLFKLPDSMNTETGKRFALQRIRIMREFVRELECEWEGVA